MDVGVGWFLGQGFGGNGFCIFVYVIGSFDLGGCFNVFVGDSGGFGVLDDRVFSSKFISIFLGPFSR